MKKQLNSQNNIVIDLIYSDKYKNISYFLCQWYDAHKRDLPWRNTGDAYPIWISEIILQQTRVKQGYDYFVRFLERFPNVAELAKANEEEVLLQWQGLGYYSRARNLHHAAQQIVDTFSGKFPENYNDILSLKGIGEYTAAAIASFAFGLPYAVVDGNVYRVLSRLFAIDTPIDSTEGKKLFAVLAQELLDKTNPAIHNQAMMELGALQCTPTSPDCTVCPLSEFCMAFSQKDMTLYPVKEKKTKVRNRYFNYLDIRCGETIYLHKRDSNDIWRHLYELPLIESDHPLTIEELIGALSEANIVISGEKAKIKHMTNIKHVLSHQIIDASFYKIIVETPIPSDYIETDISRIQDFPISRLVEKYLEKHANSL